MTLLTIAEVAERLRLHEMTVRRHIREGRLRAVRAGRRIRVREEDVDDFIQPDGERTGRVGTMTPKELRDYISRPPSAGELKRRRQLGRRMRAVRRRGRPLDVPADVLIRVARRADELYDGRKSLEDLIGEES
jgi:excisionase family DNA binding protein